MKCPKCGSEMNVHTTYFIHKPSISTWWCMKCGHEEKVGEKAQFARIAGISYTEKVGGEKR